MDSSSCVEFERAAAKIESMYRSLLNLVEELNSKVKGLELENQHLRDENNRLKGEQGKPDIKAKELLQKSFVI